MQCLDIGGTLVLLTGDILSRFAAGIICILSCAFEDIYMLQPPTSCPVNVSRWVVCGKYRGVSSCERLVQHLGAVEQSLLQCALGFTVHNFVKNELLFDVGFVKFVCKTNSAIYRNEIEALDWLELLMRNDRSE